MSDHFRFSSRRSLTSMLKNRSLSLFVLILLMLSVIKAGVYAQNIVNYSFTTNAAGSLALDLNANPVDMTTGTTLILGPNTSSAGSGLFSMPFDFYYMGTQFLTISASSNGLIGLGATVVAGSQAFLNGTNRLAVFSTTALDGTIMATSSIGKIHYKVVGIAPNRCLVIEWSNMRIRSTSTTVDATFQARLYEASGIIEYVYGSMAVGAGGPVTFHIGHNGATSVYQSVNATLHTAAVNTTINNAFPNGTISSLNSVANGSRRTYRWTPIGTTPPSNLAFTSITQNSMILNWSDNSADELGFVIHYSSDGGLTYNYMIQTSANATTFSATNLIPGKNYIWRIAALREGLSAVLTGSQSTSSPGAIVSTATGGNWNTTTTWVGGVIPSATDNVVIADGATVIIDATAACNNLTVGQGISGILEFEATNARTLTVGQSVTISSGAVFQTASSGTITGHTLSVGQDLTNNGTLNFSTNSNTAGAGITFTGNANATFSGSGTTNLRAITLSKHPTSILDFNLSTSFTVQGSPTLGFLTLSLGIFRVTGTLTQSNQIFTTSAYTIPLLSGFWLNNPNFTVAGQNNSPTNNGTLRVTSGTLNIGTSSGNSMGAGTSAIFIIEGGAVNVAGRLNSSNAVSYTQTGGIVTVSTVGNGSSGTPSFGFTSTSASNTFMMSGGTIVLQTRNTAATILDYNQQGVAGITGGTLQVGNASTTTNFDFRIQGNIPNLVIDNTTNDKSALLTAAANVYGDITINTGTTLNLNGFGLTLQGAITNNGTLTATATGSSLIFTATTPQTLDGMISSNQITNLTVNNSAGVIVIPSVQINTALTLTNGTLTCGGTLTLGTGASGTFTFTRGNGSLAAAPTFNFTSMTVNYIYSGTTAQITSSELPSSISGTLTINNTAGVTLNAPLNTGGGTSGGLALTNGILTTSATNLLTIMSTHVGSLSGGSSTSYVNGPLVRTLPASLTTESTYKCPIGKGSLKQLDLINPQTNAGGTVVIRLEVFDANCGGTPGTGLSALNTNTYWSAIITSGLANFTNTQVMLTESGLTSSNVIGRSSTLTGTYNSVGWSFSGSSITSTIITSLDYFAIGTKASLSGTIPVGSSQPIFKKLTDVAVGLSGVTLTGNVTFELQSDYDGTTGETFPITFTEFLTSGGNWTVTIKPANGVTGLITNNTSAPATALIWLNGADRITFDGQGRNLSGVPTGVREWIIRPKTAMTVPTFLFQNDAVGNTLTWLIIEGNSTSTSNGVLTFSTTNGTTGNDDNTVSFCHIRDRNDGTPGFPVHAIYATGTTTTTAHNNSGITITNNHIFNYFSASAITRGIYIITGNTDWTITGNRFYQDAQRTYTTGNTHSGINISNSSGNNFTINSNIIGYATGTGTGVYNMTGTVATVFVGINLSVGTVTPTNVQGNTIAGFSLTTSSSASTGNGIWCGVSITGGNVNVGTTTANIIGDPTGTGSVATTTSATGGLTVGINSSSSGSIAISNNTISGISASGSSSSISASITGIQVSAGTVTISSNTIGSPTIANSINALTASSSATAQIVNGIVSSSSVGAAIQGNTIANLNNSYIGTATTGQIRGIVSTAGQNLITGNTIHNLSTASANTGVDLNASVIGISQTSTTIGQFLSQNTIHSLRNTAASAGVHGVGIHYNGPTSGTSNTISRNFIHSFGFSTSSASASLTGINIAGGVATHQNNMVRLGIDPSGNSHTSEYAIRGILKATTNNNNFYFNSVYIGGSGVGATATNTYAFRRTATGVDDIRNNIFVNDRSNASTGGKHFAYVLNAITTTTSDYNIYSAGGTGGVLFSLDGGTTDVSNLQTLRETFASQELNSGIGNPNFVNPTGGSAVVDLHAQSPTPIERAGLALSAVTDDYDGQTRSSLTPTDIGADAGNFTASSSTDIFVPGISYTLLGNTSSTANRTLSGVTITDVGTGVPTAGSNRPRIWYRNLTTSSAWASAAGTIVSGTGNNGQWTFTIDYSLIGGAPASGNVIQYYLVAQDQATATPNVWYSPFIGASHTSVNVQTSPPTTPNSYTIGSAFSGTIAVGSGQTYTTLTGVGGLFEAINNGSLSGNVTVQITSDLTEDGTNALNQWTEAGAGGYTLTIQPSAAIERVIEGNVGVTWGMIRLNGADRVIIDGRFSGSGKYLRFRNASTTQPTITFVNDATFSTIRNCYIEGAATGSNGVIFFNTGITTGNSDNTVTECDIRDLSNTTGTPRVGVYSVGTATTPAQFNSRINISNNNIYNFFVDGQTNYGCFAGSGNSDWTITGNSFYQTAPRAPSLNSSFITIRIGNIAGSNFTISNNYIGGSAPNAGGAPWTVTSATGVQTTVYCMFLDVATSSASNIQGNTISNFNVTTSAITQANLLLWLGIIVNSGNVNIGDISPNIIGAGTGTGSIVLNIDGTTYSSAFEGIDYRGLIGTVQNNIIGSITVGGTTTQSVAVYGIYAGGASQPFRISGNIIGSATTQNSIEASAANVLYNMVGIWSAIATPGSSTLSNNIVANLTNNSTVSTSQLRGIYNSGSPTAIQSNQIYNLSSISPNTGTTSSASVVGIVQIATNPPVTVAQNRIHSLSNTSPTGAVHVVGLHNSGPSTGTSNFVGRNFIHSLSLSTISTSASIIGINIAGGLTTYQNNMIRLGIGAAGNDIFTEYAITGIVKATTTTNNFYHNSVYIGGSGVGATATNTYAFRRTSTGIDDIRNNIFVNARSNSTTGGKHLAYVLNNTTTAQSDYNIYRASGTGGVPVSLDGGTTDRLTLQVLRENFPGQELNSAMGDPNFVNPTGTSATVDLHVQNPTPVESAGIPIVSVADDYDGQIRSMLSPPDIGADAENFTTTAATDIFPPNISYTPLGNTPSTANRTLPGVVVTDVGTGVPTTGANAPRIWFRNFSTSSVWGSTAGTLMSGTGVNGQWNFTIDYSLIGGAPLSGHVIQYYFVAQDQAATPNLWYSPFAGASHSSVTLQTAPPSTPNNYTISGSTFAGSISVGTGQTYTSLTNPGGLFEAVNNGVLSGNVTVAIVSNLAETGTFGLNQWSEEGSGGYTMTIQPDAAVERLISGDASVTNGLIRLNGADRVVIDGRFSGSGRYLRLRNTNSSQPTVTLINDATNNTIRNCFIEGSSTSASNGVVFYGAGIASGNDYNTITQNVIRERSDTLRIPANAITSTGTSSVIENSNNTISDNEILNFGTYGINATATGNGNTWTITGNSFYNNLATPPSAAQTAIYFVPGLTSNSNLISGNFIGGQSAGAGGSPWTNTGAITYTGIQLSVGIGPVTSVQNNTIQNINLTNTGSGSFIGIQGTLGNLAIGTVFGNTIGHTSIPGSITTAGTALQRGIGYSGNDAVSIHNNLIANIVSTTTAGTVGTRAIEVSSGIASIVNNVVRDISATNISTFIDYDAAVHGIELRSTLPGQVVEGNLIHTLISTPATIATSTAAQGIRIVSGSGIVRRNQIYNLVNNSTGFFPAIYGIHNVSGSWTITNNIVSLGSGIPGNVAILGLRDAGTQTNQWFNNTICITGASGSGVNNTYAYIRTSTSVVALRNNIFFNERSGGLGYHYSIANLNSTPATNWTASSSNYNLLVASDAQRIGEWGAVFPTNRTFFDWQTSSATDGNSWSDISANVTGANLFANISTGDLHIQAGNPACWYVNGKGLPLSTVPVDFDGQSRSVLVTTGATDIGADEFTPTSTPAPVLAAPALSGTNTFTFAGRTLGTLTWGGAGTVPTTIAFRYYSGQNPSNPSGNFSNAYWDIAATGGSGYSYDITLNYDLAIMGTIGSESNIRLAKRDGAGPWVHHASSMVNTTNKTVTLTGMTSLSDFALSDNINPLPVELVSFIAKLQGASVQLDWKTASELNSFRFVIERRENSGMWREIGYVDARGSFDAPTMYTYTDNNLPNCSELFYRLRQVDRDGSFSYSNEVRVALGTPERFELFSNYPNPFTSGTTISFALPHESFVTVRVYDLTGREVELLTSGTMTAGSHSVSFFARNLPSGVYRYVITAGNQMKAGTMILAR